MPQHHQPTWTARYRDFVRAWVSHRGIEKSNDELADSNARPFEMRMPMDSWHRYTSR